MDSSHSLYFKNAPVALVVIDLNLKIVDFNTKSVTTLGIKKRGQKFDSFIDKPYIEELQSIVNKITLEKTTSLKIISTKNEILKLDITCLENSDLLCSITEEKEVQDHISDTNGNLKLFIEKSVQPVAMFDNHMNYIACSNPWMKDWRISKKGLNKNSVKGKNHYKLFSDIKQNWKEIHQQGLQGETIKNERDSFFNENGEQVWLSWLVRPWYQSSKKIGGILIFTEIITEQVKIESALIESEALNRRLVENAPIAIIIQNLQGEILFTNETAQKWIGAKSSDQLLGKKVYAFVDPEDHKKVKERAEQIFKTRKPAPPIEFEFKRLDGGKKNGSSVIIPFEYQGIPAILTVINDITSTKTSTIKLKLSEQKLRQVIDLVPHMIFAKNKKGQIVMANKAFADNYNTTIEYIEKHLNIPKKYRPKEELLQKYLKDDLEVINSGLPKVTHLDEVENSNGTKKYIQTIKVPYKGEDSEIDILGISMDITERINYEEAIKSSRKRYKTLINTNPDLIFINSIDGKFLDYHGKNEDLMLPSDVFLGKTLQEVFDVNLSKKLLEAFGKTKKTKDVQIVNYSLDYNGKQQFFEARIVKLEKDKVLTIVRDVTKQKLAEKALLESERKLKLFFSQSLLGFLIMEPEKPIKWDDTIDKKNQIKKIFEEVRVVNLNEAMATQYGTTALEMLGYNHNDFYKYNLEDGYKKVTELLDERHKTIITQETKVNGESVWIEADYSYIFNEENELISIFGVERDISQPITDEEDLKKLTDDLIKSNNELQQFAYLTSHDLRAPVVNLSSLVSFYNRDLVAPENEDVFQNIEESVSRLSNTLEDLVDIVALKKNSIEDVSKVIFGDLIAEVVQDIRLEIEQSGTTIKTNISKIDYINYSKTHLKSILQNLITNAVKYRSPNRKPRISISVNKSGDYILLKVKDNGMGIDLKKYGKRLFGLYQKFHDNPNSKGLGLFIVKSQVELLGGKIEVESTPNVGTTFLVYLLPQQ